MDITQRFMEALSRLERDGNVDEMVSLYSPHCDVGNSVSPNVFFGREGARDFWKTYRAWFKEIESSFHQVIHNDSHTAIEWSSRGTNAKGQPISYEGVSILEFDNGQISRFRAYFNPEHLGRATRISETSSDVYVNASAPA